MRLIDVKVRMPDSKLGIFLTEVLPTYPWARMIGYDLLRDADEANGHDKPKKWRAKPNPNYRPKRNTAGDVVLKLLAKKPMKPAEVFEAYKGDKFNQAALNSGIYGLRDRELIKLRDDGKYEVASEEKKTNG